MSSFLIFKHNVPLSMLNSSETFERGILLSDYVGNFAITVSYNMELNLICDIPKVKYREFANNKIKSVNKIVLFVHSNKRESFLGHWYMLCVSSVTLYRVSQF